MITKTFYQEVGIIIKSVGSNHIIGLSITNATRHKFCSYDEAVMYAMHWIDKILYDEV